MLRSDSKGGKRKRRGDRGDGSRKRSHMASPVPGPHVPGAVLRMDEWPRACDADGNFVPGEVTLCLTGLSFRSLCSVAACSGINEWPRTCDADGDFVPGEVSLCNISTTILMCVAALPAATLRVPCIVALPFALMCRLAAPVALVAGGLTAGTLFGRHRTWAPSLPHKCLPVTEK